MFMQTIKPSKGYIFAKQLETAKQTASGFFLPENAAEKPKIAEAINVGQGVTQVKPKDQFVYKSYATTEVKINKEDYLLVSEEDVLGVVLDVA